MDPKGIVGFFFEGQTGKGAPMYRNSHMLRAAHSQALRGIESGCPKSLGSSTDMAKPASTWVVKRKAEHL